MSWDQLLSIMKTNADRDFQGEDIEAKVCPNDGEPLSVGAHGVWYCKYDGYRPGDQPST